MCPRCPSVLVAVRPAAVHAVCSSEGCEKLRGKCSEVSAEPERRLPRCECADGWCRSGGCWATGAASASQPQRTQMNGATSTA